MTLRSVLLLGGAMLLLASHPAAAQFGGMPGMPGGAPGGAGFGAAPAAPPPPCQELLKLRDEVHRYGTAIQAAEKRKASPVEACKLFRLYLASEAKMIKGIDQNAAICGVPPDVSKQMKVGHAQAAQIGKQVCDAAARGPRPVGPSLSDALGSAPSVPDGTTNKPGRGIFDTLTGNSLAR